MYGLELHKSYKTFDRYAFKNHPLPKSIMHLKINEPGFSRNCIAFAIGLLILLLVLIMVKWMKASEEIKNEQFRTIKRSAKKFDEFLKL